MKFEFDDDHYAQRDAIGRYLADNAGAAALRRYWDKDSRDTTLWSGAVADEAADDTNTKAIRAFNDMVASDQRVEAVILTVGDGLTLVRKR